MDCQIVNKISHLQTQSKGNFLQMVAFQACFNSSSGIHGLVIFQDYQLLVIIQENYVHLLGWTFAVFKQITY